ncbi:MULTISPECIES: TetR/AcrR family transcriptional regulator [unclassified Streptomyces]|uniref:TetR/AcrR family transcriptional regulator n=1 Tax=unclassified Streptomyces TaxID=2593676 RepID=UPI000DC7884F|nr:MULTISPECIES: TetR/AcrR family transcriptional regulator [unclassified Streptomyces]AWZ05749.1 TetR/AcrR family transcriptional regulator [Streptomyces sp. ICC4]AWZ14413.1 TetR/AcrR family transcriptional regulator [Streptomyces sp. ICC1]
MAAAEATATDETATPQTALGTRDRLVRTASRLMQRGGYENTPVKQLVREAGATLGSLYHFFPGGKQELAVAAIHYGDEEFTELISAGLASHPDPARAVETVAELLADALAASDWREGCPVTTTALETVGRIPELQTACARAFAHWEEIVAAKLLASGHPEARARDLASTVINTLEGAETSAQVTRSRTPLLVAGRHLARLVDSYASQAGQAG